MTDFRVDQSDLKHEHNSCGVTHPAIAGLQRYIHTAEVTGLSMASAGNAVWRDAAAGTNPWLPWSDEALRRAAAVAAAADAAYVAARRARDALIRQACVDSGLNQKEIGEQDGYHRHPDYDPQSQRHTVFTGAGTQATRRYRTEYRQRRKQNPVITSHGVAGYGEGCRCAGPPGRSTSGISGPRSSGAS